MESENGEIVRQKQLAFIGQLVDRYASGMDNHLAAIRESVVWLGDHLQQATEATDKERKQFTDILATVERQIDILNRKNQHLSRFAQRTGAAFGTFNPGEVVEEVLSFSTRLARVREVSLKPEIADTLPDVSNDPSSIHFLLVILVDDMVERVGRGGEVILRASPAENAVVIDVEGHRTAGVAVQSSRARNPLWSVGQQVVPDLGVRLETTDIKSNVQRSSLFLPLDRSSATETHGR
jgi:hypothetical protein